MVAMLGELEGRDAVALPALTPLLTAPKDDVETLVRAARASIARLSLELRAAEREADEAERASAGMSGPVDEDELRRARAMLERGVDDRRAELAAEVEQARVDASRQLVAARAEAAAIVASMRNEIRRALGHGLGTERAEPAAPEAAAPAASAAPSDPDRPVPAAAAGEGRPYWARFLYVDVLLPLIAVVIVIVVLLAWVG